jgi:hypothetical protein
LPWLSAGIGSGFGLAAGVPIYVANRVKFSRENVRNRRHRNKLTRAIDREQTLLERVEAREQALAQLAVQVHTNMDKFLGGDFSMKEKVTERRVIKKEKWKCCKCFARIRKKY